MVILFKVYILSDHEISPLFYFYLTDKNMYDSYFCFKDNEIYLFIWEIRNQSMKGEELATDLEQLNQDKSIVKASKGL